MASLSLDNFATSLASMAAAGMQGRQMAQQENDAEQQRREQQALQMVPILQQAQTARQSAALQPYDLLKGALPLMNPEAQARYYTGVTNAAGAVPPVDYSKVAGAFDPDNPLRGVIAGMGGPPPATPTPPGWVQQPNGGFMHAPPTAPGFGGAVTPAGSPAATIPGGGGVTSPTAVPSGGAPVIKSPVGNFELSGVTDAMKKAQATEREKATAAFRKGGLSPEQQARIDAIGQGYVEEPKTREEYESNQQIIRQLNSASMALLNPAQQYANMKAETTTYGSRWDKLQSGSRTDLGNAIELRDLRHMEKGIGQRYAGQTDVPTANLETYDSQIGQIDRLLDPNKDDPNRPGQQVPKMPEELKADRTAAGGMAKDIMMDLKSPLDPKVASSEFNAARGLIASLTPQQQRDPEKVANLIQDVAPGLAERIRRNGLQFGGYGAERQYSEQLAQYKNMANATPEMKKVYADGLMAAAAMTGRKITLTGEDIVNSNPIDALRMKQMGLQMEKIRGEIGEQPLRAQEIAARLEQIHASVAHMKAATAETIKRTAQIGKPKPGAANQAGLVTQNAQLRTFTDDVKATYKNYYTTLKNNQLDIDPQFDVRHPRGTPEDKAAVEAYQKYATARQRVNNTIAQMNKMLPKERQISLGDSKWDPIAGNATTPPAAPAAVAAKAPLTAKPAAAPVKKAAATTGGGRYSGLTTAELARRFAKAVAAQSGAP